MAESIFNRISRIVSATVEDTVDRLEKAGGERVMREAIREADRALDQVAAEHENAVARRLQAVRQHGMVAKRIEALTGKAKFAISGERDDLAEAALSQQIDFEAQAKALVDAQQQAREEEARLAEGLAALKARKAQMEDTLAAYMSARQDVSPASGATASGRSPERRIDAAERAFERAMSGSGGAGLSRSDADTLSRVAEIDVLQRGAMIAERLAALKAGDAAR